MGSDLPLQDDFCFVCGGDGCSTTSLQVDTAEKKAAPKRQRKGGQRQGGSRKQPSSPGKKIAEAPADSPPFQQYGPPAPLEDRFRRAVCAFVCFASSAHVGICALRSAAAAWNPVIYIALHLGAALPMMKTGSSAFSCCSATMRISQADVTCLRGVAQG